MNFGLVLDPTFREHFTPPGHPESPDRVVAIERALRDWDQFDQLTLVAGRDAEEGQICSVHTTAHLQRIKRTAGLSFSQLDADTYAGPYSFAAATRAVGSTLELLHHVLTGQLKSGFAIVRPPGHHAGRDRAMGFCLFNNVAIAAQQARKAGLKRVAIVDFDVHHGNGTQEIFYERDDVLYVSLHQYPFYPGTGHFSETGSGMGEGFTANFPIRSGMGNYFYCKTFQDFVIPILRQYRPELIIVSAGYDAHRDDSLGGMRMDEAGYAQMVHLLNSIAAEVAQHRIIYVLEGGYNLTALGNCVRMTVSSSLTPQEMTIEPANLEDYTRYSEQYRRALSDFWKFLK
ncbi:MAG: histone deacetylase [Acidobacteria bacterium]|nr:histone deacetylase [Acidobacteriota bacterium]